MVVVVVVERGETHPRRRAPLARRVAGGLTGIGIWNRRLAACRRLCGRSGAPQLSSVSGFRACHRGGAVGHRRVLQPQEASSAASARLWSFARDQVPACAGNILEATAWEADFSGTCPEFCVRGIP